MHNIFCCEACHSYSDHKIPTDIFDFLLCYKSTNSKNVTECIKRKMNQETLLGFGNESDDESMNGDGRCSPGTSNRARGAVAMLTTAQGTVSVPLDIYAASDGSSRTDQEVPSFVVISRAPLYHSARCYINSSNSVAIEA